MEYDVKVGDIVCVEWYDRMNKNYINLIVKVINLQDDGFRFVLLFDHFEKGRFIGDRMRFIAYEDKILYKL